MKGSRAEASLTASAQGAPCRAGFGGRVLTSSEHETQAAWTARRLEQALGGDRAELRQLIDHLAPVVHARVARLLLRRGGALDDRRVEIEDLTQAVFLALFERDARTLRRWSPERGLSLANFVGLVAQRLVVSRLRTARHNPWTEELAGEKLDAGAAPENLEGRVVSKQRLQLAMQRLQSELNPRAMHLMSQLWVEGRQVKDVCDELPGAAAARHLSGTVVRSGWLAAKTERGKSMADDDLLREALEIERAAHDADPIDPRWDLVASGELSEADARRELVRGPRDEALLRAFRPLDGAWRERILAQVQPELRGAPVQPMAQGAAVQPTPPVVLAQPLPQGAPGRPASVTRVRPWPRRAWALRAGLVAAAAAAVVLLVRVPGRPPALPHYDSEFSGGEKLVRGAETAGTEVVLRPGSRVEWTLRPATAVTMALGVRTFVRGAAGVLPWPCAVEVSPQGAVHVSFVLAPGELPPGTWELLVVIGDPAHLPDSASQLDEAVATAGGSLYVARQRVDVGASP
jgi:DNA-directed RNA polymerase specialized sigma24 family protein